MDDNPSTEAGAGRSIRLRIGDVIPADAVLSEGDPIEVGQSALTGESLPGAAQNSGDTVFIETIS